MSLRFLRIDEVPENDANLLSCRFAPTDPQNNSRWIDTMSPSITSLFGLVLTNLKGLSLGFVHYPRILSYAIILRSKT